MKKIGIMTFHNAHNYGAMLQVFALQNFIKNNYDNVDVKVINYENKKILSNYKVFTPIRKNLIKYFKLLSNDIKNYKINSKRYNNFDRFMNTQLNLTDRCREINSLDESFDICITGSDQVWNPDIVGSLSNEYTLNFGNESMKRVSYAASIGDVSQVELHKKDFKEKIGKIDNISVREIDAQIALEKLLGKNIEVVLDPTMLLTKNEWNKKLENLQTENEKYILAYVVKADEEYIKIVNDLSERTGLKIIHFEKDNHGYNNVLKSAYTEGPYEFVNLIKNAEYIVATSFHATVFSIIFNKKFFIVPHKKTGARVINLVNTLGIENRLFDNFEQYKNINIDINTDWNKVNEKLNYEREKSIKFIENAIEI